MKRVALKRLEAGLPARWYYADAQYKRELEAFWYRRWIAVAREEEISTRGTWRTAPIGTQSILLVRSGKAIRAFHNVCRHRGSVLCTADQGRFARERIVCSYHSWTYDLAGKLVATPRRMETPDFDMKNFPLFEVGVATWGGFVFVCLEKKNALKDALGSLPRRFGNHRFQNLRIGKRIVADVKANWKLLCE